MIPQRKTVICSAVKGHGKKVHIPRIMTVCPNEWWYIHVCTGLTMGYIEALIAIIAGIPFVVRRGK